MHKPKTWEYVLIIAIIIIAIIILFFKGSNNSSTNSASNPQVIPGVSGGNGGVGPVNITFTNLPSTSGIATYIPLFGFVRSGYSM